MRLAILPVLAVAAVSAPEPALAQPEFSFGPGAIHEVALAPRSIATADFNGDGRLDLAVACHERAAAFVLLAASDYTFQAAGNYPTGRFPVSAVAADLDGDHKIDLAVANYRGNDVSVLLGRGDGTFDRAVRYPVGNGPQQVIVGDFNGDTLPDLALANCHSANISVLLGTRNGSFEPAVHYAVPGSILYSLAATDLDQDGSADLITANEGSDSISVMFGRGDGTFRTGPNFKVGAGPICVIARDLNGDDREDLAVANSRDNTVGILLHDGTTSLHPMQTYKTGAFPRSLAVGDLNRDGQRDLAVANEHDSHITILPGLGDGRFGPGRNIERGSLADFLVLADLNADGGVDLIAGNKSSVAFSILYNRTVPAYLRILLALQRTWWILLVALLAIVAGTALAARSWTRRRIEGRIKVLELENAVQKERARIAQDMHDELGSSLTHIAILSELARNDLGNPRRVAQHIAGIARDTREVVGTISQMVWLTTPENDTLDNVVSYLREYAAGFLEPTSIACTLDFPDDVPPLPVTAKFRRDILLVTKESLNNVVKHSQATEVRMSIQVTGGTPASNRTIAPFTLLIHDNGRGFDPAKVGPLSHGFKNMRRRLADIGGTFDATSALGQGTQLIITVGTEMYPASRNAPTPRPQLPL